MVLSVGSHTRLPRTYRGRDILWWLDRIGSLDRTIDDLADPGAASREPSLQLAGTRRRVDLDALRAHGVRLAGRLVVADAGEVHFADDLAVTTAAASARMRRVLAAIDRYAGIADTADPPLAEVEVGSAPKRLNLHRSGIGAVVWATGFRPAYPWLRIPVLDASGRLRHQRGVTEAPGLYAIGLRFQHRRNATFIDGARHDAAYLADHIAARQPPRLAYCRREESKDE